jgi:hypothetical protein
MKSRLIRCILDAGGVAMSQLDETAENVRAHGPVHLPLDGWDRASTWGWDEETGSLYAHLRRNDDDSSMAPTLRIEAGDFGPVITLASTLAQHVAAAVDCDPWDVLTALYQVNELDVRFDDDATVDDSDTVVTMRDGYNVWPRNLLRGV